jgi:signal transduction histidine kinase
VNSDQDQLNTNGYYLEEGQLFALPNSAIRQKLEALTSANLSISSKLDLDTVLQSIVDNARNFAGASYAALGIVDKNGVIASFITSGISKEDREKIGELPRGHGLLGVLIKHGKPLRVANMAKDPRSSGFPPNHPPMTSLLGVPVSLGDHIIGDLYLTDKLGISEFTEEEEWWLTLFARQAAVAVQNARLYQTARLARQRAETLAELIGALNNMVGTEEIFLHITAAACRLLSVTGSALYLLAPDRSYFKLQAQHGLSTEDGEEFILPIIGSVAGRTLEAGTSISVEDTSCLPQIYFPPMASLIMPQALLVVPIRQRDLVSGVIEVYSEQPRNFSLAEISLLEAFAGQAALALDKARLFRQKEHFLSMIAHDLRAPLTAINMSAGLLQSSLPPDLAPAYTQLAANITRNGERLNNLLQDLLELNKLENGRLQLHLEELSLINCINASINALLPLFENKSQQVIFVIPDTEYMITADHHRVEQILTNLLTNANKYSPEKSFVRLTLEKEDNWVKIGIADNGPGIPPEDQMQIFERYYRRALHEQNAETHGSGLGLSIARYLIELHGGKIWVESHAGQGSTFYIKLPFNAGLAPK